MVLRMANRAITFEGRFTVVPGSLPGIGCPSLHAFVRIAADAKQNQEGTERVDAVIRDLLPAPPQPAQGSQSPQLPAALLAWNRLVQEAAGWPTAIDGIVKPDVAREQSERFGIAVPFLEGCVEEAAHALTWVIDVANDAVGGTAYGVQPLCYAGVTTRSPAAGPAPSPPPPPCACSRTRARHRVALSALPSVPPLGASHHGRSRQSLPPGWPCSAVRLRLVREQRMPHGLRDDRLGEPVPDRVRCVGPRLGQHRE